MKPKQVKCELINVRERKDGKIGSSIKGQGILDADEDGDQDGNDASLYTQYAGELDNNNCHEIVVDESVSRVKSRLQEQYMGDPRDGVFLSRGMTNININTKGDIWDINQEDWNWYTFSKTDVLDILRD